MPKYGKLLENGGIEFAPRDNNGISNWIENEADVLAAGYLPMVIPETPKGMSFKRYIEQDGVIVVEFQENYKAQREAAYPEISEQLDMIYWDKVYGTNHWVETITAIKSQYPKP